MEFEYRPEIDVEGEHESAIMCGLDPRKDCAPECHLYPLMQALWSNHLNSSGRSYPSLVETFRDPGNEGLLEDFRKGQSETLRRRGFIENCDHYPRADITQE